MSPNAYYNYRKNRKKEYRDRTTKIQKRIVSIYHREDGVPGYRQMQRYLTQEGYQLSPLTCHYYMSGMRLRSIVRRRKPDYVKGTVHKVFANILKREFSVSKPNLVWATDFTYLSLTDGTMHYNCTIIDLYDRSVVATLNGASITAALAIKTLQKALKHHKPDKGLILHSDQGSQFTSREFTEFCEANHVQQSMSQAGCPYDNAPMERFYNTLKNERINLHYYHTDEELNAAIEDFAYVWYNHVRPHTYNNDKTPFEARNTK